jgi:hypothetical protein
LVCPPTGRPAENLRQLGPKPAPREPGPPCPPAACPTAKNGPSGPQTTSVNTCPERASEISRGSSEATPPDHPRIHAPAPRTGCQKAYLAPTTGAESDLAVTHHIVPCGSPGSPPHATCNRMGRRWKHRTPSWAAQPPSLLLSTLSPPLSRPQAVRELAGGNAQAQTNFSHRAPRPSRTFPVRELFHSPGLPRQRLPGVLVDQKPEACRASLERHTTFVCPTPVIAARTG